MQKSEDCPKGDLLRKEGDNTTRYEVRSGWKDVTENDWNAFLQRGQDELLEETPESFAVPPHLAVPDLVADDGASVIEDPEPPTPGFVRGDQNQRRFIWYRM
ncbi:hypothetical protein I302_105161 [Kwoniella bestiolae CBS 10118]|uniref:Uncharacterized protein n=1 Tax=Kwoniella bestiolae CBS 10118 TaxID=1296100 RepID=A0A1B9FSC7_9TREE|nr:hypothetical protein I302_08449 [Kwoniella bestiolae CBS 10118]OCF21672.1 hypothetical protein I302_08449 [Kwoniella bestiolae CBS 10118]